MYAKLLVLVLMNLHRNSVSVYKGFSQKYYQWIRKGIEPRDLHRNITNGSAKEWNQGICIEKILRDPHRNSSQGSLQKYYQQYGNSTKYQNEIHIEKELRNSYEKSKTRNSNWIGSVKKAKGSPESNDQGIRIENLLKRIHIE